VTDERKQLLPDGRGSSSRDFLTPKTEFVTVKNGFADGPHQKSAAGFSRQASTLGLFDHRPGPRAKLSSLPRVGDGTSSTVLVSMPPLPRIQVIDPTHGAASLWTNDASYCAGS
jgi:hypothetical protein